MVERLRAQATWHLATVRSVLRQTQPWVVLVPAVGALVISLLNTSPTISPYLAKDIAEIVSPVILGVALAAAVYLAASRAHAYDRWQALFALALLMRELHFQGTNTGFYIALVALFWWASYERERLEPFISDRSIVTLVVAILWTYAVTKTLDRRYWDDILPAGTTNDLFEENLEILGHLLFLMLVVVSSKVPALRPDGIEAAVATGQKT